jgi:hypothetical protein
MFRCFAMMFSSLFRQMDLSVVRVRDDDAHRQLRRMGKCQIGVWFLRDRCCDRVNRPQQLSRRRPLGIFEFRGQTDCATAGERDRKSDQNHPRFHVCGIEGVEQK